ncbi:MAG: 2-oxo-tetronate isomerase [Comamonas sp.]|nr:hydroxypyruvate isomerase family protein [Comamonas sp.]
MLRFAANLSMLYGEHAFLERFAAAAADGFEGVEYLFPYDFEPAEIAGRLRDAGLTQALFNAPPGDWGAGERGIACLPGREAEFRSGLLQALAYAHELHCTRVHVMAGVAPVDVEKPKLRARYLANLQWAAEQARPVGVQVLIEPINRRDFPGYFLARQDEAHAVVQELGSPNLKVQMDLYHCQVVEGDVAMKIRDYLPTGRVGHFQIAGVPERHEPDEGELNIRYLLAVIDEVAAASGWDGWLGCEYRPRAGTREGLAWLRELRAQGERTRPAAA